MSNPAMQELMISCLNKFEKVLTRAHYQELTTIVADLKRGAISRPVFDKMYNKVMCPYISPYDLLAVYDEYVSSTDPHRDINRRAVKAYLMSNQKRTLVDNDNVLFMLVMKLIKLHREML